MATVLDKTADTSPTSDDIIYVINDPSGTPADKKVSLGNAITKAHGLSDGIVKTASGILVPATAGTDYVSPSGLTTALSGYQPLDSDLTALAGISGAQGDIIYHNGTNWTKLAAGTSGKVLQTNGTGANPSWVTPAAGGASKPLLHFHLLEDGDPTVSTTGRSTVATAGTGARVWNNSKGLNLNTGSTINSYAHLRLSGTGGLGVIGPWQNYFDRTLTLVVQFFWAVIDQGDSTIFIGIGGSADATLPGTTKHFGLQVETTGGGTVHTYKTTNADGTTQTTTDISGSYTPTLSSNSLQYLVIEYVPATSITYYINGTSYATHTTNIPSGDAAGNFTYNLNAFVTNATATPTTLTVQRYDLQSDAY